MYHRFDLDGKANGVWLSRLGNGYQLQVEGGWHGTVALAEDGPGQGHLTIDGERVPVAYALDGDVIHIHCGGRAYALHYVDPLAAFARAGDDSGLNVARAPMPGVVVAVKVAPGDEVLAGTVLMVIESMKLETSIRAPQDGIVEKIHVKAGDSFDRDALLATLLQENG